MERWRGGTDCISENNGHHPARPSWHTLALGPMERETSWVVTGEGGRAQTPGHLVPRRATHPSGQRQGSLAHFLGPSPPMETTSHHHSLLSIAGDPLPSGTQQGPPLALQAIVGQ